MAKKAGCPCKVPVNSREDFLSDPFFASAREVLEQARQQMEKATNLNKQPQCKDENQEDMQKLCQRIFSQSVDNFKQIAQALQAKQCEQPQEAAKKDCACSDAKECGCGSKDEPNAGKIVRGYNVAQREAAQGQAQAKKQANDRPERYEVVMDMAGFKQEDIVVCTENNTVQICAIRQCKTPKGVSTKKIKRRIVLPPEVDPYTVACNLSCDGVLVISAEWKSC